MPTNAAVIGTKDARSLAIPAGEFSFRNFNRAANPNDQFISLGHCSSGSMTWNINKIEKRDASRGTRELIASAETQRDLSLSITMDQWDPVKVALAQYGETAIIHLKEETMRKTCTVSPGDEVFLLTSDGETAAYNYKGLAITRIGTPSPVISAPVRAASWAKGGGGLGSLKSSGAFSGAASSTYTIVITSSGSAGDSDSVGSQESGVWSGQLVAHCLGDGRQNLAQLNRIGAD